MPPLQLTKSKKNRRSKKTEPENFTSSVYGITGPADFTRELREVDNRTINVSQWFFWGALNSTAATPLNTSASVMLSNMPDYLNYGATYDQYKINSVEYVFKPLTMPNVGSTLINQAFLYVFNDYDDDVPPVNTQVGLSYNNVAILYPGESHTRIIKPHVALAMQDATSTVVGSKNSVASWIDCASPNVPHFGVKMSVTTATTTNLPAWALHIRINASFKNQR